MKRNPLPIVENKVIKTKWGQCIGHRAEWDGGMYCSLITNRGIVGCGAYDVVCLGKAKHIVAISRGTEKHPYLYPEQLLQAPIMDLTDDARKVGIRKGMKGKEALRILLELDTKSAKKGPARKTRPRKTLRKKASARAGGKPRGARRAKKRSKPRKRAA